MGIYLVYRPGYISFTRAGVFIHYRDVHFKPFVNWLSHSFIRFQQMYPRQVMTGLGNR